MQWNGNPFESWSSVYGSWLIPRAVSSCITNALDLSAHSAVYAPTFSPHLAKFWIQCVCPFYISGTCRCVGHCLWVWVVGMCNVHQSGCSFVCADISQLYKSYLPVADIQSSSVLWFEPPDLSRTWVQTWPGDITKDWKFFSLHTYLISGRGYIWSSYFLRQLSAVIELLHWLPQWLPIMPADCQPWGTSVWLSQSSLISPPWCLAPPLPSPRK